MVKGDFINFNRKVIKYLSFIGNVNIMSVLIPYMNNVTEGLVGNDVRKIHPLKISQGGGFRNLGRKVKNQVVWSRVLNPLDNRYLRGIGNQGLLDTLTQRFGAVGGYNYQRLLFHSSLTFPFLGFLLVVLSTIGKPNSALPIPKFLGPSFFTNKIHQIVTGILLLMVSGFIPNDLILPEEIPKCLALRKGGNPLQHLMDRMSITTIDPTPEKFTHG